MQGNNAKLKTSLPLLIALALAGCGGGDDSSTPNPAPAATTLSGTAAAGAPISGTVTVRDSDTNTPDKIVDIKADGSFNVDVSGLKAPFMLQAAGTVGDRSYTIYSAATAAGTVNVTPLTDLVVANAAGGAASTAFEAADFSKLTDANLDAAENILKTRLAPVLQATGSANTDLMNGAFAANHTGIDAALDLLDVSVSGNTATITVKGVNATMLDDLSTTSDKQSVSTSADAVTAVKSDNEAIVKLIEDASAKFAAATDANDASLRALFNANSFLSMGEKLDGFLGMLFTHRAETGEAISFDNVSVQKYVTETGTPPRAWVSFLLMQSGGQDSNFGLWVEKGADGTWRIIGDQMISDIVVQAMAVSSWFPPSNGTLSSNGVRSGINFFIGMDSPAAIAKGLDHATVQGAGVDVTLTKSSTSNHLGLNGTGDNVVDLTDAAIDTLSDNTGYTITLYDGTSNVIDSYTLNLPKVPVKASTLDARTSFPMLTDNAIKNFDYNSYGTFTMDWTMPYNLKANDIGMFIADANGNNYSSGDIGLNANATSKEFKTNLTGIAMSGYMYLDARDVYGRKYSMYIGL